MSEEPIPGDVRDFVLDNINSVAQLEALLLLRREGGSAWRVPEVARRLYVPEAVAADVLNGLCTVGLLSSDGEVYRYAPGTEEMRMAVDKLADAYSRYLIPVTNLIHNNPSRLRRFADAFRFRRD
jgi:hypothetical protein